ncbi:MAG: serine hydrolase [Clostridia bacterium]|nr:serine hydrolase [Clostridia bacterium]
MLTKFTPFKFETAIPETVGVDSAAIAEFERAIREKNAVHQGYMVWKDGKLAASSIVSPYRITDKRHVYSVSKSWTATAIGIAVDEGLLTVEDTVISFFPDLLPENVSENLAKMKVKHLLSMNTGHQNDTFGRIATAEPEWAKRFLALPVENEPGTHFCYNTTATYMLSAIITKLTGMRMADYLRPRLFNPLGIEGVIWDESPEGINFGGWGIHVSAEDILKLGVLYLNKGVWNGKRILSEAWVEEATSSVSDNSKRTEPDWRVGYGYQIWRCQNNCYRFDGAYGQYGIICPNKNCVIVLISELGGIIGGSMQDTMNIFWDTIYAGIHECPLPIKKSCDISAHPYLEPPCGTAEVTSRSVRCEDNKYDIKALDITPAEGAMALTVYGTDRYAAQLICAHGEWEYNKLDHCPIRPCPGQLDDGEIGMPVEIAASYAVDNGVLTVSLMFVTSPHGMTLTLTDDKLTVTPTLKVAPTEIGLI